MVEKVGDDTQVKGRYEENDEGFMKEEFDPEGKWSMIFDPTIPPVDTMMAGYDYATHGPKKIVLSIYLADIFEIDTVTETFKARVQCTLDWTDDGVIKYNGAGLPDDYTVISKSATSAWSSDFSYKDSHDPSESDDDPNFNPHLELVNGIEDTEALNPSDSPSVIVLRGRPVVNQYVHFLSRFRSPFDLSNFPFDESELRITLQSGWFSEEEMEFVFTDMMYDKLKAVDPMAIGELGKTEFKVVGVRVESEACSYPYMDRYYNTTKGGAKYQHVSLCVRVRRDPRSYLLRVASVSTMLMLMEAISFLTEPNDLAGRFGISGTNFLSQVAFYFVTLDTLPKSGCITRCDRWNLVNFFLMFLSNTENFAAFYAVDVLETDTNLVYYVESRLAVCYTFLVLLGLVWFMQPLLVQSLPKAATSVSIGPKTKLN